ncbi:887_t:CDS:2, partial [Scutellospora calospora]
NNGETIIEVYKRINDESEAIAKKTNGRIYMRKSGNYTLTTIKFFKETTLALQKSEKISEQENVSWPIAPATIEGNPLKKSLQYTRYLHYNLHRIYIYYDLECTRKNKLKSNILYKIKKEGGIEGKVSKALLVLLWGVLSSARKRISEIVKPLEDQVKRIHTDSFIIAKKVKLKTGIEMGELKFEKNGVCVVKNCISITWKLSYPEIPNLIIFKENEFRSTNSLSDFEKIQQDKKQNTILDTKYPALQIAKRKLSKKSNINLLNEIIIEIFQYLQTQNKRLY